MNDIFPPLSEMLRDVVSWFAELFVSGLSLGVPLVVLPVAGAFVTRQRARTSPRAQRIVGWAGFLIAMALVAVTGVGMVDINYLQVELVPWIHLGLTLVGGPWLWWVTTIEPKTKSDRVALGTVYFSALILAIWTVLSYQ